MRTVVLALVLVGCGDDSVQPPAHDGPLPADAPVDAPIYDTDALPPDLLPCSADEPCPDGTDCLRVPWLSGDRRCLRRCSHTADCGLNEVCYDGVTDATFAGMADHCFTSICFAPLAACELGAEIGLLPAERRPGTCLPVDDHGAVVDGGASGPIGKCLEAGDVGEDLPCELQNPARGGLVCAQGMVCTGGAEANLGRCQRLCDPTASPDPCETGRGCFDSSQGTTTGPVAIQATWGFCRIGTRCTLFSSDCPTGQACLPTNPIRANGFCTDRATGGRALGEACVPFGVVAPSSSERCQQALCDQAGVDADGGPSGICRPYCDVAHACATGACDPYTWDEAGNLTQGFGVCR